MAAFRRSLFLVLSLLAGCAVLSWVISDRPDTDAMSGAEWETQPRPFGGFSRVRTVAGEWAEQRDYDSSGLLESHRYWDSLHRMHDVTFDATGREVTHEIRN